MASIKKGPIACSVCHTFNLPSATHCRTCNHDLQIRGTNKDLRGYLKSFWTSESLLVLSGLSLSYHRSIMIFKVNFILNWHSSFARSEIKTHSSRSEKIHRLHRQVWVKRFYGCPRNSNLCWCDWTWNLHFVLALLLRSGSQCL